jgi:hypothetical protein
MKWSQRADRRVVEAVVMAFRRPDDNLYATFLPLSVEQWERSYYWLDASGMALYLLTQLEKLDLLGTLPRAVRARLEENLADNTLRSESMFAEFTELNAVFQAAGFDYCNLKGFTLSPNSCPSSALRNQLDFDFLIDGAHLDLCREILAGRGYILHATPGTAWEFKTKSNELADISNLYRVREQRCIELHFPFDPAAPNEAGRDIRLDRISWMEIKGVRVPVLSPVEQFIGQATHVFSHLCGSSTRLAWLLELRNHIESRFEDELFWIEVLERIASDDDALRVGVACLVMKELLTADLPDSLTVGLLDRLPSAARLWVRHYASRAVLADFPGTKLYLFLREQIQSTPETKSDTKRQALLPLRRPLRIVQVSPEASFWKRLLGELWQIRYELYRCRFHLSQGLAYLMEVPRWQRILNGNEEVPQSGTAFPSPVVESR